MKLFKKKSDLELEIKKYPRWRRKKLKEIYDLYQKGVILQPGKDINNKEYIFNKLK